MNILLTGATGFIGSHLLPKLLDNHHVWALTRNPKKIKCKHPNLIILKGDLLQIDSLQIPKEIDTAFYFAHSMKDNQKNFDQLEKKATENFRGILSNTSAKQIIYIGGLSHGTDLSKHMQSRKEVEEILSQSKIPVTIFRCGIIVGSGSASFEIIRDLTEKLPIMIAPKWISRSCDPIDLDNVLEYLLHSIEDPRFKGQSFEISGPDRLTYKELLYEYAKIRKLNRLIITVPVLTPRLSSLWLYFVTSTNFALARSLIDSVKNDAICDKPIPNELKIPCLSYEESLEKILSEEFPTHGILQIEQKQEIDPNRTESLFNLMRQFSKSKTWYSWSWLWNFRNFIDVIFGGLGLAAWEKIVDDDQRHQVGFRAKMKMPGEAWLRFTIEQNKLSVQSIFRPRGVIGRLYWYLTFFVHKILFHRLCHKMISLSRKKSS